MRNLKTSVKIPPRSHALPSMQQLGRLLAATAMAFVLSGAAVLEQPLPLAVGLVAAWGAQTATLGATLGAMAGYFVFWGLDAGLIPAATVFLVGTGTLIFRGTPLVHRAWFPVAITAVMQALLGVAFLLDGGLIMTLRWVVWTLVAAASSLCFQQARQRRLPGALLFLFACLVLGLNRIGYDACTLGLAFGVAVTVAATGTESGLAVGVTAALALSLSQPGGVAMSLALPPLLGRRLRRPVPRAAVGWLCVGLGIAVFGTAWQVPAALLGCLCALPVPQRWFDAPVGTSRARRQLTHASEAMRQVCAMLGEAEEAPPEANAAVIYDRVAEQVCRLCGQWTQCWEQNAAQTFRELSDAAPAILARGTAKQTDFPPAFVSHCLHLENFTNAVSAELDRLRHHRQYATRLQESRAILGEQYRFLGRMLQHTADEVLKSRRVAVRYVPEVGIRGAGRQGAHISGDRGGCFRTPDGMLYLLLCDGMGTGPGAAQESAAAVNMLTSLLQAGADPGVALQILNGVYLLREDGGFSTVDLAAISLVRGKGTLYKWGASPSYLHAGSELSRLGEAAPPPGLGSGFQPERIPVSLRSGELLVLLTDGASGPAAEATLQSYAGSGPKELSRLLIAACGEGQDDETAVVIRLRPQGEW